MNFKSFLASAALALAGLGVLPAAHAAQDLGVIGNALTWFGNSFGRPLQSFTDYYTFELDESSKLRGGALALDFTFFNYERDLDIDSISLSGNGWQSTLTTADPDWTLFSFSNLSAGSYVLTINGSVPGDEGGSYIGALYAIASPAPEPEVLAMAALGLLGVGFAARRRKSR